MDRRDFLRASAVAAASVVVTACGGSAQKTSSGGTATATGPSTSATAPKGKAPTSPARTGPSGTSAPSGTSVPATAGTGKNGKVGITQAKPLSPPSSFKESPQLASLVKSGKLDPVEKRLPQNPYVVPHEWVTEGKYGGVMRWICSDTSDWSTTHLIQESMYGHSPIRWLHDGREIGPGLAESWETNDDQTVWTLHFRKGLRWSDGHPWTVDDVMFWWEDEVMNKDLNPTQGIPDDVRSGKGSAAQFKKVDDYTLQLAFDAPTPLTDLRIAKYVKRGQGVWWMDPKHYMQQFHIKYNRKLNPKKWTDNFFAKQDWATNPDNPTMTGWKLKQYKKGQYSVWERNPYYWCVDKWGNQLPFMDGIVQTNIQDQQVMRLSIQQGKADFVHGPYVGLTLADVSTVKSSQSKNNLNVTLWDSGSGTASIMFFNYDYYDDKYRKLFRDPKFRKALSHAFDRATARKTIYYNQGEPTTGTYSPKTIQFSLQPKGPKIYDQWRSAALKYDPELAKKMLDDLGVVDKNGDGWREMPDGSRLVITLDYPSPGSPEHVNKNQLLAKDWQAIGINAKSNPVTPTGFSDQWAAGKMMTTTAWELSDTMDLMISPQWLLPIEPTRWAPLEGTWYSLLGSPLLKKELNRSPWQRHPPRLEPEKGGPVDRLWKLYARAKVEVDPVKRNNLVWQMFRVHIDEGPFFQGTVANYPQVELIRQGMKNVPLRDDLFLHGYTNPWHHPTPAVYDPEAWYWENPSEHSQ